MGLFFYCEGWIKMNEKDCPLTEEQQKFAEKHHGLLLKFMSLYHLPTETNDERNCPDWYGVCATGFCKAVKTYDPAISPKFSSYAFSCMKNEYYEELEKLNQPKRQNEEKVISLDDDMQVSLLETLAKKECPVIDRICFLAEMNEFSEVLTKKERKVAELSKLGYNREEMAKIMNTDLKEIKNLRRSISRKRKKFLNSKIKI